MKIKQLISIVILLSLACFSCSYASSPEAWNSHGKNVIEKCIKAANLLEAKSAGELISYDDEIGVDALIIQGKYPQAHMNKQPVTMLCLYDRKNQKAYIAEANHLKQN